MATEANAAIYLRLAMNYDELATQEERRARDIAKLRL
jgi:hypothetical protein